MKNKTTMLKPLIIIGLLAISFGSISQSVIKEIILKVCIDDMDKLHIKNGIMAWEHVGRPGTVFSKDMEEQNH